MCVKASQRGRECVSCEVSYDVNERERERYYLCERTLRLTLIYNLAKHYIKKKKGLKKENINILYINKKYIKA